MFAKKLLLLIAFVLLVGLFARTGHTSATPLEQETATEEITASTSEVLLFEESWPFGTTLPNERWETYEDNGTWYAPEEGLMEQSDGTEQQINIAYETPADIADGVILGSMKLLTVPGGQTLFPHGFVFRYSDVMNFYGVGFIDEDTLGLGRMEGGVPDLLVSADGYNAEIINRFMIVLKRDSDLQIGRVEVFVAEVGDPFPVSPAITYITSNLDSPQFRAGKVGIGTYGAKAQFGPVLVDFDCSEFYGDLSAPGQVVFDTLAGQFGSDSARTFCGNRIEEVIELPGPEPDVHREAFVKYADLIATAKYEVAFTTMIFDNPDDAEQNDIDFASSSALALLGYDPRVEGPPPTPTGLPALYEDVVANPEDYPYGVNVRILVGKKGQLRDWGADDRLHVLSTLKRGQVPLCYPTPDCEKWRIEVVYHRPIWRGTHSHVKLLVVDREEAIISGYNVQNFYYAKAHDLGIHVAGPAAYDAMQRFQKLWSGSLLSRGLCKPGVDDILTITNFASQCQEFPPGPAGIEDGEYPPPVKAIKLLDENQFAFTLYRSDELAEKEADNAIPAGLRAATDHIYIWQERFYLTGLRDTPVYMIALEDVIKENVDAGNTDFVVRLLLGPYSSESIGSESSSESSLIGGTANLRGINRLRALLGSTYEDYFQVRIFVPPMHTKALAIDGGFLIIGSQNWDHSAWGEGGVDLPELNLGVDNETYAENFDTTFIGYWNDPAFAQEPCDRFPDDPNWSQWGDCEVNLVEGTNQVLTVWLHDGIYQGSNLEIDQPVNVVGLGAETILEPETPLGNEPILRITASDVSLIGLHLRNSAGYAIEIGDGVNPVENVFIGWSVFADNTLGGIKVNGPASIYTIANNTFAGGEAGLLINVSGSSAEKSLVQNNLFSGQTVAPVQVDSAGDGRVDYSYNLFDNCIRAVGGVCPDDWLVGALHPESKEHHNLVNVPVVFRDPGNGDYQVIYPSAALDAADPASVDVGYHGDGDSDGVVGADIGALEQYTDTLAPPPILLSPQPGATVTPTVTLVMSGTPSVEIDYEIATDGQFLNLVASGQTFMTATEQLDPGVYYWRAQMDDCCSDWSAVRQLIVAEPWVEGAQLTGEAAGDNFGQVVAAHQETLVVGAPEHDGQGAVYVYVTDGLNWRLEGQLTAADGAAGDAFGASVAIHEDTIVVGAPGDDDDGTDSGSVYVFEREGTTWTQEDKLLAERGRAGDGFGYSVAVSGSALELESIPASTIVVGAPWARDAVPEAGAVYVFKRAGSGWQQQARLVRPLSDGLDSHHFGHSVALDGAMLLIGVPLDPVLGYGVAPGSAYVFVAGGVNWNYQQRLLSSDLEGGDRLGVSVAISNNTIIVGAEGVDDQGTDSGAAYVFSIGESGWEQAAKLVAAGGEATDYFGHSVDVDGADVVVGAYGADTSGADAGAVYFYSKDGSNWILKNRLIPLDGAANDWFGYSVALDGAIALVGAYGDDDNGAAYVANRLYE